MVWLRSRSRQIQHRTALVSDLFVPTASTPGARMRHLSAASRWARGRPVTIGQTPPEQHPIKSAKIFVRSPYFVARPVVSTNARFGYVPLIRLAAAFAGAVSGKPSSLVDRTRASIGGPLQGRII